MKIGKYVTIIGVFAFSLISICPTFAGGTAETTEAEDCADMFIFNRLTNVTACDLEKMIDDAIVNLTDVKITKFSYRLSNGFYDATGKLHFSANYNGDRVLLKCKKLRLYIGGSSSYRKTFSIYAGDNCRKGNITIPSSEIDFDFPVSMLKREAFDG